MNFLLRKWVEKVVKALITAVVAYATGPAVADATGVDPDQARAGLWVLYTALTNWLKHQSWLPGTLRKLL